MRVGRQSTQLTKIVVARLLWQANIFTVKQITTEQTVNDSQPVQPLAETIKPATLGSVSSGTLRTEDLLNAFGDELEWQMQRNGHFFSQPENFALRDKLVALHGEHLNCFAEDGSLDESKMFDGIADEVLGEIQDALSDYFAAPYCYFGTHKGDGADFGFWASRDSIEELPTVEGSDEALALGEDCKSVNDHGNVTVYSGNGNVILELV